jgi:hypothetical protein
MARGGTDFSIKAVDWLYGHDASILAPSTGGWSPPDPDPRDPASEAETSCATPRLREPVRKPTTVVARAGPTHR